MTDGLRINQIYWAIEGEGRFVGTPQIFIRLQGCRVACINCDSKETWSFKAPLTSIEEILKLIKKEASMCKRVLITGGDPLDPDHRGGLLSLVSCLKEEEYIVAMEVSGQRFVSEIFEKIDFISCDIKTPSTGVKQDIKILEDLYQYSEDRFQIKGVVANKADFEFIKKVQSEISSEIMKPWFLTPCFEPGDSQVGFAKKVKEVYSWVYDSSGKFRVVAQQHKWIYGPDKFNV